MRPISTVQIALAGVNRQLDRFERAAVGVARAGEPAAAAALELSSSVTEGAAHAESAQPDLPRALVDVRVSKYMAVANLKALSAGDAMTEGVLNLVRPSPR